MNNSPTIMFIKDLQGRFLYLNRMALKSLGCQPEDYIGKYSDQIVTAEAAERIRGIDQQVIATRNPVTLEETIKTLERGHPRRLA